MNFIAKFDEIPSEILEVIKETKCCGHMSFGQSNGQLENTVCGGIIIYFHIIIQ